jgi:hypothetical protein
MLTVLIFRSPVKHAKKLYNYAFIHFNTREEAELALRMAEGYVVEVR